MTHRFATILRSATGALAVMALLATGCADTKTVFPRDDFTQLILGKTAKEVIRKIGKPKEVRKKTNYEVWLYEERTKNMETGRIDWYVRLFVRDGKMSEVAF